MYRVGISSCGKVIDRELFEDYSKNSITDIEISESGTDYSEFDFRKTQLLSKEYSVNIWSLHLPFYPAERFDISVINGGLRKKSVETMSEIIKRGSEIGINKFVIHPSSEPIDDGERATRIDCACESLSKLADLGEKVGAVICVENLPRTCLGNSTEEMKKLVSADERLQICFDTNHIAAEKPEGIIISLAKKIVTLHISDFDFIDERHWLPGEGKINWKNVMQSLGKINYSGAFMYEVDYERPSKSRDLTAADFYVNAEEIFEGKELTIIP